MALMNFPSMYGVSLTLLMSILLKMRKGKNRCGKIVLPFRWTLTFPEFGEYKPFSQDIQ